MAPDAEAAKSLNSRPGPFAPLTSQLLPVGDGHEIYVETVGRSDGISAVYLHGGPGSGCQPDLGGCSIRSGSTRCSSISAARAEAAPKAAARITRCRI